MAHNDQQNKKTRGGGPQAHPDNQAPAKRGRSAPAGGEVIRGGNKVRQGRGADTGNKGKSK
jgi:hypothetical protein